MAQDHDKSAGGSASGSASGGRTSTTVATTTVTTKQTVEEYALKRRKPLWVPIAALVAAPLMGFWPNGSTKVEVAAPVEKTLSVETTVAVETTAETTLGAETTFAVETTLPVETTVAADTTLAPETTAVPETTAADTTIAAPSGKPIAVVAAEANNFKVLTAAIGAAGLTDTLTNDGKFTVFAPTDEAFAKLPPGLVDALVKPENKDVLTKILTYHVLSGETLAKDIVAGDVATVEGATIKLSTDGGVKVNDATVITADIPASNGVVHAIDTVLLPPGLDVSALLPAPPATPESLTVYFANNSSRLNAEAQAKINGAIEQLKKLPAGTKVNIVGHASKTGNSEKNEALSIDRANNVQAALIEGLGGSAASAIQFSVEARGDTQPDADEATSRRVTIEIQP